MDELLTEAEHDYENSINHKDRFVFCPKTFMPGRRFQIATDKTTSKLDTATAAKSRNPDNIEAGSINQTLARTLGSI